MKLTALLLTVLFMSATSFAADAENTNTTTVDHSTNPITGTHKTKVKHHRKKKNAGGADVDHESTETTKVHKDGTMKKDVEEKTEVKH